MFERFTESARRVIFFARYEASEYGSYSIETEHLLLGLLREDHSLATFLGKGDAQAQIRAEIEPQITRAERIPTSVEIPLTNECRKILKLAAEESERLGHRYVGTEHLLLGMFALESSLASRLLHARGLNPAHLRERVAKTYKTSVAGNPERRDDSAKARLESFLAGLKWQTAEDLIEFFAQNSQITDVFGKRWDRKEIFQGFVSLFAPYAKKNADCSVEETYAVENNLFVASVVWKNAILASLQRIWIHRMSVVLIRENDDWHILLMHVTPVQPPASQA